MKRARLVAFSAIALVGCRAVLGIESLTVEEDASVHTEDGSANDAATDTTLGPGVDASVDAPKDAPHDARPDQSAPPDGASDQVCNDAGQMCQGCCRNTFGTAVAILEHYAIEAGCLCTSAATCLGACDASICGGDFTTMASMGCNDCIDPLLAPNSSCSGATGGPVTECVNDTSCSPYLGCLGGCPPP